MTGTRRRLSSNLGAILIGLLLLSTDFARSAVEPISGTLVFAANPRGVWELFLYQQNQPPARISNHALDASAPALSPTSTRIAYMTSDGGLWVSDARNGTPKKLAARFSNGQYGYPTWISDDLLAYTTYTVTPPTEDSDIYAYSFKEAKQRILVKQTGSQDFPNASASGNLIAFMSSTTTQVAGFGAAITQQLWTASLRTGKLEQLATGSARDTRPVWSPDEKRIAFSSDRKGGPNIWLVDVETKGLTQLTMGPGEETSPNWSPDSRQILFVSSVSGHKRLKLVDVATGTVKPFNPFTSADVELRDPAWRK